MPKETLVLRDFTSGFIGSEHGSDLPSNSIVEGANINVNTDPGIIKLSGSYIPAKRPDDISLDGTSETFNLPGNFIGHPGRGLFYFTSDYNSLSFEGANGGNNYEGIFEEVTGMNYRTGQSSSLDAPTEYFVIGSRHHNHRSFVRNPGYISSTISIYQYVRPPHSHIDLLENNLGNVDDGFYNSFLLDIPMGGENGFEYKSDSDPLWAKNWFPVYYWASGALRVCDGGFLAQNTNKLWIGYVRDSNVFSNSTIDGNGATMDISSYKTNKWVIDRGGNTDETVGQLYSPVVDFFQTDAYITPATMTAELGSLENKIIYLNGSSGPGLENFGNNNGVLEAHVGSTGLYHGLGETIMCLGGVQDGNSLLGHESSSNVTTDGTILFDIHARNGSLETQETQNGYPQATEGLLFLPLTGSGTARWTLYFSYVYQNGEESKLIELGKSDSTNPNNNNALISQYIYSNSITPTMTLDCRWAINATTKKTHPRIKGAKAYIRTLEAFTGYGGTQLAAPDYYLISEVDFEKGSRSPGEVNYSPWYPWENSYVSDFKLAKNTTSNFSETFYSNHGYAPEDIGTCYYKTACVVNNRTYVGNVKFDGALFPDRIMKTPVGEYDVFTRFGFIDVQVDDGDAIVHLEAFADRILQFKENVVHVINISKEFEFLEFSTQYAGIICPSQVTKGEKGIYWGNRQGLWWYDGQKITNLLLAKSSIVNTKDTNITSGIVEDTLGHWKDLFNNKIEEAPVLSYDPINKDIIIMTQLGVRDNLITEDEDSFVYNSIGNWSAQTTGSNSPVVAHNSLTKSIRISTTTHSEDQGILLNTNYFTNLVVGDTYRVTAEMDKISGFSTDPIIKFKLGNVESSMVRAYDNTPAEGHGITTTYQTYQADITVSANADLFIYHEASTDDGVFDVKNIAIKKVTNPVDDIAFIYNTDKDNLMQLHHHTSRSPKSNAITTVNGDSIFSGLGLFYHNEGTEPENGLAYDDNPSMRVWHRDPYKDYVASRRNLYMLTKAIDFKNHAQRKVIQSIHFTYKTNGESGLVPFVKAYYLDGTAPETYYMCTSSASSVPADTTAASINGVSYEGRLPDSANKFETFKYKHVLSSNVSGNAASMRSKIKNVGSIQIGLIKLATSNNIANPKDFAIEEISITHRTKSPK